MLIRQKATRSPDGWLTLELIRFRLLPHNSGLPHSSAEAGSPDVRGFRATGWEAGFWFFRLGGGACPERSRGGGIADALTLTSQAYNKQPCRRVGSDSPGRLPPLGWKLKA
jgi:hypothetical protein